MRAPEQGEQEPASTAVKDGTALRCHCGSLIARLVSNGVEIKCRRCKRTVVIPLNADPLATQNKADSRQQSRDH